MLEPLVAEIRQQYYTSASPLCTCQLTVNLGKLGNISLPRLLYLANTNAKEQKGDSWPLYQLVADAGQGRFPSYHQASACECFTWVTDSSDQRQCWRLQDLGKETCKTGLGFHHGLTQAYHDLLAHLQNSWEASRMKNKGRERSQYKIKRCQFLQDGC